MEQICEGEGAKLNHTWGGCLVERTARLRPGVAEEQPGASGARGELGFGWEIRV